MSIASGGDKRVPPKLHPIQIQSYQVLELAIRVGDAEAADSYLDGRPEFTLSIGCQPYNENDKTVAIKVRAALEPTQDVELPVKFSVELAARFSVDTEKFKEEYVNEWASKNAFFILYPYLREQVYALSQRAGLKGIMLPLLEVPTYKVMAATATN
jgi:preprotein translocase subunit SecB